MNDSETDPARAKRFAAIVLPHLNAAYNLARWLVKSAGDAEDIVQEAYLRAYKFFDGFRGEDARPWLLAIVRNASFQWLSDRRAEQGNTPFDEELHSGESEGSVIDGDRPDTNPAAIMERRDEQRLLNEALLRLPPEFREALVLRDLEDLSYKEIAAIAGIPIGTVMSRLARARKLMAALLHRMERESCHGL
jgi:RNA polymerase sigma factor (sigma-70 family)